MIWYDYSVGEYIGLTHGPEKVRFGFHIKTALTTYIKYLEGKRMITPTKLSAAIIAALKDKGFSDNDLKKLYYHFKNIRSITTDQKLWNFIQDLSDSHFEIKVLEIHKNEGLGYEREIQLTKERNLVEEGINIKLGGGARKSAYVFLPLYDIIGLISLGFSMKAITSLMKEHYGIHCHEETVRKRIIEFFGGWDKAQQMFLKPVVEALTYEGYNHREIYKELAGNYRESKGWIYEWFVGKQQLDFDFWMDKSNFDTKTINKIIEEVKNTYYGYTRSQWEEWMLEGKSKEDIKRDTGLTESMVRSAYRSLGGKREFINNYRVRRTIELRKQGWSLEDIYIEEFGFRYARHLKRDFGKWFKGQFPGFTGDIIKKIEETWSLKNIGNYLG